MNSPYVKRVCRILRVYKQSDTVEPPVSDPRPPEMSSLGGNSQLLTAGGRLRELRPFCQSKYCLISIW